MGRSKWAWACALFVACSLAVRLSAEDEPQDPFAADQALPAEASYSPALAERRIEFILDQPLKSPLQFPQTPLNTISSLIADEYDIPIQFDSPALDAIAVSPDVEVNVDLGNVTLRLALDLMLRQVEDLTYVIDNEVLLITTEDEANSRLEVRIYRVDDLVREDGPAEHRAIDEDRFEALNEIIASTVERDSWAQNKTGEGEILRFAPGMFVVSQTHRVHGQIGDLLTKMRQVKAEIEADAPHAAAERPVTRGFQITSPDFTGTPESRDALQKAIVRSTSWNEADEALADGDTFLDVLPNRVIVRHVPRVIREVERTLVGLDAAKKIASPAAEMRAKLLREREETPRRGGF